MLAVRHTFLVLLYCLEFWRENYSKVLYHFEFPRL